MLAVKPLPEAKTRLGGSAHDRAALVVAMLVDVIGAAAGAGMVPLVVTPDARIAGAAREAGALVVGEPADASGLNAAFSHGQRELRDLDPAIDAVMFLQADLPAVTSEALRSALAVHRGATDAWRPQSFVADSAGVGTAALLRPLTVVDPPLFGPHSAASHRRAGAVEIAAPTTADDPWRGLRTDVDTVADLRVAADIGVGAATAEWLHLRAGSGPRCAAGDHGA